MTDVTNRAIKSVEALYKINSAIALIDNDETMQKGNSDFWDGFYTVKSIVDKYTKEVEENVNR